MNKKIIILICVLSLLPLLSFSAVKSYTVTAYVVSGTGAIRAVIKPAEFTIPAGKTATITKFYRYCPTNGEWKKLGKNVYCVTTKSYMVDAKGNPLYNLPPGKYKFSVGGYAGAYGKLSFSY